MVKFLKRVLFLARDAVVILFKIALVFIRALGISVGLILVAGAVLVFALYGSGYFHKLTRFAIEKYMSGYTRTECRVGRVEGSLLTGLDIYDFAVGDGPSLELLNPSVFQLAPMLVFAPLGPGSYERPQIRLVYRFAYLNEGALDTYAYEDPRHNDQTVHYIGLQAEWWFNSSYR